MIVFDSSTLILLAKVELLDTFLNNYRGRVIIPKEVEKEATVKDTFDALLIKKRVEEKKLEVRDVQDKNIDKFMEDFNMGRGESEAVALALKEKSLLATDDKNAINACRLLKVPFTTAIGILVRAKEKGLLTKEEANKKLEALAIYGRYKKEIIEDAKRRCSGGE